MRYARCKDDIQTQDRGVLLQLVLRMRAPTWPVPTASATRPTSRLSVFPAPARVNPMFILRAFQRGADGVILCGCHPGDCHYTSGNYYARRRMTLLFSMLDYLGIEKERTRVEWVSAAEGAKFAETMNSFVETVRGLGENKRLEDIEMQKIMIAKAKELLQSGAVDRVLGWKTGEFANDITPAVFDDYRGARAELRLRRLLRRQPLQVPHQGLAPGWQDPGLFKALRHLQL